MSRDFLAAVAVMLLVLGAVPFILGVALLIAFVRHAHRNKATALIDIAGALVGVAGEGLAAQVEKPRLTETPSRVK